MRLFDTASGNTVTVALDHGLAFGAPEGFRDPGGTLDAVLGGGPDAVSVSPPFRRHFRDRIDAAGVDTVLASDVITFSTLPGRMDGEDIWTRAFPVSGLVDQDPVAVKLVLVFGREDRRLFADSIAAIPRLRDRLAEHDIPLVVEPVLWGPRIAEDQELDPGLVHSATRMAWEYGADVLKVPYPGDEEAFGEIVRTSPAPVVVLGGPASGDPRGTLEMIGAAQRAGARGVFMGRRLWQIPDPAAMVGAVRSIVHEGASVQDASERLGER